MRLQSEAAWDLNTEDAFAYMSGALDGDSLEAGVNKDDKSSQSQNSVSYWPVFMDSLHLVSPPGHLGFLHADSGPPKGLPGKWKT